MAESKFMYRDGSDGTAKRIGIWDDDDPFKYIVYTEQDLTQTIENNKIFRDLHPRRGDNKLIARGVPLAVAEQAMREQWDERKWAQWLDDPDNAAFRVWQGRVGK